MELVFFPVRRFYCQFFTLASIEVEYVVTSIHYGFNEAFFFVSFTVDLLRLQYGGCICIL